MKITKATAMSLWKRSFGYAKYVEDFHGYLMYRDAYGDDDYFIVYHGNRIYCGWKIHHILPTALGGTDAMSNLICTNIATDETADDKITYWIDDCLYQVQRIRETNKHEIVKLKQKSRLQLGYFVKK